MLSYTVLMYQSWACSPSHCKMPTPFCGAPSLSPPPQSTRLSLRGTWGSKVSCIIRSHLTVCSLVRAWTRPLKSLKVCCSINTLPSEFSCHAFFLSIFNYLLFGFSFYPLTCFPTVFPMPSAPNTKSVKPQISTPMD